MTDYALEIVAESQDLALTVTESVTTIAVTVAEAAAPIALTVGVQGPPGPPGADGGADLTADALMLLTYNSLGFLIIGGTSAAGSDPPTPSTGVQALIDQATGLGIPEAAIGIIYTGEEAVILEFIVADVASLSEAAGVVLTQSGGVFTIAAASSLSGIENIIITSADVLVVVIQDAGSASEVANVVISQSGGVLAVADVASLSEIENITITSVGLFVIAAAAAASEIANVVMTQHGGTFAVAAVASASGIDNVVITEGGVAGYFAETSEGWTLSNLTLSNGANNSGSAGTYGSVYGTAEGYDDEGDQSAFLEMTRPHDFVNGQVFSVWYKLSAGSTILFVTGDDVGDGVAVTADNDWHEATYTWVSGASPGDTLKVLAGSAAGAGNFVTGYLDDFTITGP
jgi:hypothetical protein